MRIIILALQIPNITFGVQRNVEKVIQPLSYQASEAM